jgi:hypothetical protein
MSNANTSGKESRMDIETEAPVDDLTVTDEAEDEYMLAVGRTSTNDPTAC